VANADNATVHTARGDDTHAKAGSPSISAMMGAITKADAYARAYGAPEKGVGTTSGIKIVPGESARATVVVGSEDTSAHEESQQQ